VQLIRNQQVSGSNPLIGSRIQAGPAIELTRFFCHPDTGDATIETQGIPMNIAFRSVLMIAFLLAVHLNAHAGQQFFKVNDKRPAELAEVLADAESANVIFVGEAHDLQKHHEVQLDIIRGLYAKKVPLAIGLEMFSADSQRQLDDWTAGKLDEQSFKSVFSQNWSIDWSLYRDIFIFARDNHIPMIALNIPKKIISKVAARGSAALDKDDQNELPPQMSWELHSPQTDYLRKIFAQVFGTRPKEKLFANFCEAQALRNRGMAWNITKYLKKQPATKVVALAGTWHAVKSGIPEQLGVYDNLKFRVILPEMPEFNTANAPFREVDYLIMK
jgi:uncharacterized iron-regulated protein